MQQQWRRSGKRKDRMKLSLPYCGNYYGERYEGTKPPNPKKFLQNIFVQRLWGQMGKPVAGRVWGCSCMMFLCVCVCRQSRYRGGGGGGGGGGRGQQQSHTPFVSKVSPKVVRYTEFLMPMQETGVFSAGLIVCMRRWVLQLPLWRTQLLDLQNPCEILFFFFLFGDSSFF